MWPCSGRPRRRPRPTAPAPHAPESWPRTRSSALSAATASPELTRATTFGGIPMRVLAAFLILLVACGLPAAADPYDELSRIPADQVLVDFKDDVPLADVHQMAAAAGVMLEPVSPESVADRLFQGSVPPARMDAVVAAFSADPRVESAEPNAYMAGLWKDEDVLPLDQIKRLAPTRSFKPNDPLYKYQWHMHKIGMEAAWVGSTGRDAIVAVIDTGVAYEDYQKFMLVEDLKGIRFVKGWNYIGNNEHANDDHAHGTHVAGTIAQATNNGVGVTGIAFNCSIMPLKVLSARGFGSIGDIAAAIRFAANHGANVINMSLGGPSSAKALESAVQYAHKKG
ncbi:MAG: hypothetical protein FJX76_10450, partial [Armatimonadetes bacterium]|nr:hypothetical protein [Armatimonadota bacterium]